MLKIYVGSNFSNVNVPYILLNVVYMFLNTYIYCSFSLFSDDSVMFYRPTANKLIGEMLIRLISNDNYCWLQPEGSL